MLSPYIDTDWLDNININSKSMKSITRANIWYD